MLSARPAGVLAALACAVIATLTVPTAQATPTPPLVPVPYVPLPQSFDELPLGPATTLPWWQNGVLHVDGTKISTSFTRMDARNGTVVIGRGRGTRHSGGEWYLVDGDQLDRLPTSGTTGRPLISANGRWVAWLEERATAITQYKDDTRYRAVIYDARAGTQIDVFHNRRKVAWEDGINAVWLHSIDNTGRLYFTLGHDGRRIWRPGRRPIPLTGASNDVGQVVDGWPRGITLERDQEETNDGVYGTVDRTGQFTAVGELLEPRTGFWSGKGEAYAYSRDEAAGSETYWADRIDDGTSVQLGMPPYDGYGPQVIGWESAEAVILWLHQDWGDDRVSLLVRCDTTTGDCERVRGGPRTGSPATMPDRY